MEMKDGETTVGSPTCSPTPTMSPRGPMAKAHEVASPARSSVLRQALLGGSSGILAYTFFGLDALGDQLAAPFGREPNCMPLDSITRIIEISLLHALGRKDVPEPILAENYTLS